MATGLIDIMKLASMDAADNAKLADLRYGTVVSTNPLSVQITNQFTLPASTLIVPKSLTNHTVTISLGTVTTSESGNHTHSVSGTTDVNDETETTVLEHTHDYTTTSVENGTHSHSISGTQTITINNALQVGDKVALIRQQGGQTYYILDRI